MNHYRLCPACKRHVKGAQRTCPFCSATANREGSARRTTARLATGAEWVAIGSALVLGGCSGKESPSPTGASSVTSVAFGFECGDAACARGAQFCYVDNGFAACESYDAAGVSPDDGGCGSYPTCGCYQTAIDNSEVCGCSDDHAGGLTVSACSHHSCYGSPPARFAGRDPLRRYRRRYSARS